jgi:hypothetical protein
MANARSTWGQGLGTFAGMLPMMLALHRQNQAKGPTPGTETNMFGSFPSATQGYGRVGAPGGITQEGLPPALPAIGTPGPDGTPIGTLPPGMLGPNGQPQVEAIVGQAMGNPGAMRAGWMDRMLGSSGGQQIANQAQGMLAPGGQVDPRLLAQAHPAFAGLLAPGGTG